MFFTLIGMRTREEGLNNGAAIETAREALLPPEGVSEANHSLPLRIKNKSPVLPGLLLYKEGFGLFFTGLILKKKQTKVRYNQ